MFYNIVFRKRWNEKFWTSLWVEEFWPDFFLASRKKMDKIGRLAKLNLSQTNCFYSMFFPPPAHVRGDAVALPLVEETRCKGKKLWVKRFSFQHLTEVSASVLANGMHSTFSLRFGRWLNSAWPKEEEVPVHLVSAIVEQKPFCPMITTFFGNLLPTIFEIYSPNACS